MGISTLNTGAAETGSNFHTIAAWRDYLITISPLSENEYLDMVTDSTEGQINFGSIVSSASAKPVLRAAGGRKYNDLVDSGAKWEGAKSWGPLVLQGADDHIGFEDIKVKNTHSTAADILGSDGFIYAYRSYLQTGSAHASADGLLVRGGHIESCIIRGGNGVTRSGGNAIQKLTSSDTLTVIGNTIIGFDNAFAGTAGTGLIRGYNNKVYDCDDSYDITTLWDGANSGGNASFEATTVTPPGSSPYLTDLTSSDFNDYANGDYGNPSGNSLNSAGVDPGIGAYSDFYGNVISGSGPFPIGAIVYAVANTFPTKNKWIERTLVQGENIIIPQTYFEYTDTEETASQITYTLKEIGPDITPKKNGVALNVNDTWTQADVNSNLFSADCSSALRELSYIRVDVTDGTNTYTNVLYVFHLVSRVPDTHLTYGKTLKTWMTLPGQTINTLQTALGDYPGTEDRIIVAWSGGVRIRRKVKVRGGGHGDYAGNGFVEYDLEALNGWQDGGGWSAIVDIDTSDLTQYNFDNRVKSEHSYDKTLADHYNNELIVWGLVGPYPDEASFPYNERFLEGTGDWELPSTIPDLPSAAPKGSGEVDAFGNYWMFPRSTVATNIVISWNRNDAGLTQHGSFGALPGTPGLFTTGRIAHNLEQAWTFGAGHVYVADISAGHSDTSTISYVDEYSNFTGDTDILDVSAPGVEYYEGKFILHGKTTNNADVYEVDPIAKTVSKLTNDVSNSITPVAAQANGTFGRVRFFKEYGILFAIHSTTSQPYAYKYTDGYYYSVSSLGSLDLQLSNSSLSSDSTVALNQSANLTLDDVYSSSEVSLSVVSSINITLAESSLLGYASVTDNLYTSLSSQLDNVSTISSGSVGVSVSVGLALEETTLSSLAVLGNSSSCDTDILLDDALLSSATSVTPVASGVFLLDDVVVTSSATLNLSADSMLSLDNVTLTSLVGEYDLTINYNDINLVGLFVEADINLQGQYTLTDINLRGSYDIG